MTSSTVSSMLLFLLLLVLVFSHMDKALGEQMQHRKLKETDHSVQLTTVQRRVLPSVRPSPKPAVREFCRKYLKLICKGPDILDKLRPPPPPRRFSKGKNI